MKALLILHHLSQNLGKIKQLIQLLVLKLSIIDIQATLTYCSQLL